MPHHPRARHRLCRNLSERDAQLISQVTDHLPCVHPAELTLRDIYQMNRTSLIEQLLAFNDFCSFQFSRDELWDLPNNVLRGLVYAARRHYHLKGY